MKKHGVARQGLMRATDRRDMLESKRLASRQIWTNMGKTRPQCKSENLGTKRKSQQKEKQRLARIGAGRGGMGGGRKVPVLAHHLVEKTDGYRNPNGVVCGTFGDVTGGGLAE